MPGMVERGFGRMIFVISDTLWKPPTPVLLPTSPAKAALVGIMRTLT